MTITHLNPPSMHRSAAFSQGTIIPAGARILFVGGQNGVGSDGKVVGGTVEAQTEQALRNVLAILAEAGASQKDVAKMNIHIIEGTDVDAGFGASLAVWGANPTAITVMPCRRSRTRTSSSRSTRSPRYPTDRSVGIDPRNGGRTASAHAIVATKQPHHGTAIPAGRGHNGPVILLIGIGLAIFVVPWPWNIPVVILAAVLEFVETFGTWRWSLRGKAKAGPETLVGGSGRAITEVRPEGLVRVRGEDWRARSDTGVDAGHRIRVVGREQLTLLVEPIE